MLIDTATLGQHLNAPDWVIFDCRHDLMDYARGAKVYAEGHLPGAFFAPMETALAGAKTGMNGRHPLPKPEDFAEFLNQHGITAQTQIVAYDDVGGQYAARFWWLARWIGLTRVGVLDGGLPKWLAEGRPVSKDVPAARPRGSVVPRADMAQIKTAAEVLAEVQAGGAHVIDARAAERYRGETEPIDKVAGHIPTARNRFFKLNLNPDLTMRPAADLKKDFEALLAGWRPEQVIHQCGSGVTACVNLLAMEQAGLKGSKLYPGSWSEWSSDATRPVAKAGTTNGHQ
jgi:thiosulfate/3-mercaptopyruvate sulfurtransferase